MDGDLREFYAKTYPRLVRVLGVACGSRTDAEEVVQEAFLRLIPRWNQVRTYDDPEGWLRKVAFRLLSNRARGARALARFVGRQGAVPDRPPPTDQRIDVGRALAQLPANQRHVVVLHHLVGLPVEQIATELGIAAGTVKSRLGRGRAALAPLLREELEDHA